MPRRAAASQVCAFAWTRPAEGHAFAAAIELLGGSALTIGNTLEFVHPDRSAAQDTRIELAFFVRAWASAQAE